MLYNCNNENIESYKERNLYYKIFAGYFFNELLPEYYQNKKLFSKLLIDKIYTEDFFGKHEVFPVPFSHILNDLFQDDIQVSFDYHLVQIDKGYQDRGEMSDVIIWGKDQFISIEVKYLSDWTYDKDIVEVQDRIKRIEDLADKQGIQLLLLSNKKWENGIKKLYQPGSNLKKLIDIRDDLEIPLIVITWEQLAEVIQNQKVKAYINKQLERK